MTGTIRVLILEDLETDAELEVRELRRAGFDPHWTRVETEGQFAEALNAAPDVILADYSLPGWNSSQALEVLQARGCDVPFIVVSGTIGEETAVSMIRHGAADYVLKDRLARLGPAVQQALEARRRREEQRAIEAALRNAEARAYAELLAASRVKDEFLAMLSHELRTPLNAILGYARMLRMGILAPGKQKRAVEVVERNAGSLGRLVGDLLDVSRIVSGKIQLNVQPVNLDLVLRDSLAAVRTAAEGKRIRIRSSGQTGAVVIPGDPDRLRQVLGNLLVNAIKFTPSGGKVEVQTALTEGEVRITVSDTGIGIKPEFLPHVFERFRQADSSITREHGGLGLGLAIARSIVEMHGGRIEASSAGEGQGARFVVRLPISDGVRASRRDERRGHQAPDLEDAGIRSHVLAGVSVVAVDDDGDALSLVQEVLELAGARVTTASSARRALLALEGARADVLLSDLAMRGMDGFALIARVRESRRASIRDIPAAALTAYARADDRTRALRAGFRMHLTKPIHPGELVAAVAALAGQREPRPAMRPPDNRLAPHPLQPPAPGRPSGKRRRPKHARTVSTASDRSSTKARCASGRRTGAGVSGAVDVQRGAGPAGGHDLAPGRRDGRRNPG